MFALVDCNGLYEKGKRPAGCLGEFLPGELLHRQPARAIPLHKFHPTRRRRNPPTLPVPFLLLHLRLDFSHLDRLHEYRSSSYEVLGRTLTEKASGLAFFLR